MDKRNRVEAESLVRRIIELIGDDPSREGLEDTPARVVRSWSELYGGYEDSCEAYGRTFRADCDQMVALRDIGFHSTCEHHMLPFHGHVDIAYLPQDKRVLGVSKLARIVNAKARRLQIQERMTQEIADEMERQAKPLGVIVVVTAVHLCMVARGIKQHHSRMVTSRTTGMFRDNPSTRSEALALLGHGGKG